MQNETRCYNSKEKMDLNFHTRSCRGREMIVGGGFFYDPEGKCVATFSLDPEPKNEENAKKIGEKILELWSFVDRVEHDCKIVIERSF